MVNRTIQCDRCKKDISDENRYSIGGFYLYKIENGMAVSQTQDGRDFCPDCWKALNDFIKNGEE